MPYDENTEIFKLTKLIVEISASKFIRSFVLCLLVLMSSIYTPILLGYVVGYIPELYIKL